MSRLRSPGSHESSNAVAPTNLNIALLTQIETAIVQSATPANVDTVVIDGRIIKTRRISDALRRSRDSSEVLSDRLFGAAKTPAAWSRLLAA